MKIAIVGGGPAGLYLGYLLKRDHSGHSVDIFEQNPQDNTRGFGVVFSDRTLDFLEINDPETYQRLIPRMEHWERRGKGNGGGPGREAWTGEDESETGIARQWWEGC